MSSFTNSQSSIVLVGTGLTALNLGWKLKQQNPSREIMLVEKSRGCGGRMATRRIEQKKFDHGAQFIKTTELSAALVKFWTDSGVAQNFPFGGFDAVCGQSGITQLAKSLAANLNITYDFKVTAVRKEQNGWSVTNELGKSLHARQLVLTCPLPQSLEILSHSQIPYDPALSDIHYTKALVLLIEGDIDFAPYQENVDANVFSVCSQKAKGNSSEPAWTIVMSADWSDQHFDKTDEQILAEATAILKKRFDTQSVTIHLKKWRYCQPRSHWQSAFTSPQEGLFLGGDAFGGASLLGALRSSNGLLSALS